MTRYSQADLQNFIEASGGRATISALARFMKVSESRARRFARTHHVNRQAHLFVFDLATAEAFQQSLEGGEPKEPEQWVEISKAVKLTGVPRRTLYAWVKQGRVKKRRSDKGKTLVHVPTILRSEQRRRSKQIARGQVQRAQFHLTETETRRAKEFFAQHAHESADSRVITYCITVTGIGNQIVVRCVCGADSDITDYNAW